MKKVYIKPESEIIRLSLSSPIADEGPLYTTSKTVDPETMDARGFNFQFDEDSDSEYNW
uniref:Uncharacterized protein n=5 Tax=unclassified Prevotella TaxID=2638335 RepID=A0AB33JN39_9BACT